MFKQQHKLSIFTICGKWVFRLDQSSVQGYLGAISLKNLTNVKIRKGADQSKYTWFDWICSSKRYVPFFKNVDHTFSHIHMYIQSISFFSIQPLYLKVRLPCQVSLNTLNSGRVVINLRNEVSVLILALNFAARIRISEPFFHPHHPLTQGCNDFKML